MPAATFQASVQTRSSTYEKRQAPHDTKRNNPASSPFVVDGDFSGDRRLPNPELTQSSTSSEAVYPRTKKSVVRPTEELEHHAKLLRLSWCWQSLMP